MHAYFLSVLPDIPVSSQTDNVGAQVIELEKNGGPAAATAAEEEIEGAEAEGK